MIPLMNITCRFKHRQTMTEIDDILGDRKPSPYWDNPEDYLVKRLGEDVKPLTEQEQAEFSKITEDYWRSVREIGEKKLRTFEHTKIELYKDLCFKFEPQPFLCNAEDSRVYRLICLYFSGSPEFESQMMNNGKKGVLRNGIYLSSGLGVGKTTLMQHFVARPSYNELYHNGANIIVSAQKMVSDYQREGENGGEEALDRYIKAKVLTINDVGREPECVRYGKRFSPVEMVFSARYDAWQVDKQFVTHITTNITDAKEIENRYGDYIRNRFLETMNKIYWDGGSKRG